MAKPHESLDKIGLFRSLDPKEIAGLEPAACGGTPKRRSGCSSKTTWGLMSIF